MLSLRTYLLLLLCLVAAQALAQNPRGQSMPSRGGMPINVGAMRNNLQGRGSMTGGQSTDSLKRRDKNEDSITIFYRLLDRWGPYKLDSSVSDFTRRFPIKAHTIHLGNLGSASRSLLFSAPGQVGLDPGLHAYDLYQWKEEDVRFFQTTRPYSEINYQLGSRVEQLISLLHTQNIKPNWNFMFQYRLVNSPGIFQHQRSNHNNYLFSSRYQSKSLRYHVWMYVLGNRLQSEESGGIIDTTNILSDPIYNDRFNIPVWLGGASTFSANFFSNNIATGNRYQQTRWLWRQQYDLGKKDSLVTDSTVVPLFFPRFRMEHQVSYDRSDFTFFDLQPNAEYYTRFYPGRPASFDSLKLRDNWRTLSNIFSLYQFPDAKNLQQYIKLGAELQLIQGSTPNGEFSFFNTIGHFLYRNLTRNKKWEMELGGQLFLAGEHSGNYRFQVQLQRVLANKKGALQVGALQINRTPSFIFDSRSSFFLTPVAGLSRKENYTQFFALINWGALGLTLRGDYFLVNNFSYLADFQKPFQATALFNVMQVQALKTFQLTKRFFWHAEFYFQQRIGAAPLNLMPFFTRQRIAYEGNLGFKNLRLAAGIEFRYRPPYKADRYSPLLGQFFFQDSITISNPLPDMAAYVNFRIRPFTAFIRAENLNTARNLQGFGFTRNNLLGEGYPLQGLHLRAGIFWQFIN
ncbi:MAG: putative porin [Sphingomonadales bacterium]